MLLSAHGELLLSLALAAGFVAEAALLLSRSDAELGDRVLAAGAAALAGLLFLGFFLLCGADLVGMVLAASCAFGAVLGFASFSIGAIAPANEEIVFCETICLWAVLLPWQHRGWYASEHPSMGLLLLAGTVLAFIAFIPRLPLTKPLRFFLYVWHLCVVVWIGFSEFAYGDLDFFFGFDPWTKPHYPSPARLFFAGMALMYLCASAALLAFGALLPIAAAGDVKGDQDEAPRLFAGAFSAERPPLPIALAVACLQLASFAVDRRLKLGMSAGIVNACLGFLPTVLSLRPIAPRTPCAAGPPQPDPTLPRSARRRG